MNNEKDQKERMFESFKKKKDGWIMGLSKFHPKKKLWLYLYEKKKRFTPLILVYIFKNEKIFFDRIVTLIMKNFFFPFFFFF